MPIFRLDPIDTSHRDWSLSTYRNCVIVRAPDARIARVACMHAFGTDSRLEIGQPTPTMPWTQGERATCELVEKSQWPAEGPTAILQPTISHDEVRERIAGLSDD